MAARVRRRRLAVVAAIVVGFWLWAPVAARAVLGHEATRSPDTYTVRPGDTLWSIARRVAPREDPRIVIDELMRTNPVDPGAIVPGQVIRLPG